MYFDSDQMHFREGIDDNNYLHLRTNASHELVLEKTVNGKTTILTHYVQKSDILTQNVSVTTSDVSAFSVSIPSGYKLIAAIPSNYAYGCFVTHADLRFYKITQDAAPAWVKNTAIGNVMLVFYKTT